MAPQLSLVLRHALEGLAFQAPDMSDEVVNDQVLSHLRHHPDPLGAWETYRSAFDIVYDLERDRADPYEMAALPRTFSHSTALELAVSQWRNTRDTLLQIMVKLEEAA